jgi:hypothetical protein
MNKPLERGTSAVIDSVIDYFEGQITEIDDVVDGHLRTAIKTKCGHDLGVMYAIPENQPIIDGLRADLRKTYLQLFTERIEALRGVGPKEVDRTRRGIDERIAEYEHRLANINELVEEELRQIIIDEFGFTYDEVRAVPGNATIIDALMLRRRNDRLHTLSKRIEILRGLQQHLVAPIRDEIA